MIFKNRNFIKRDSECTNIVACIADKAPNENYVEASENVLAGTTQLYIENNVRYFGHL